MERVLKQPDARDLQPAAHIPPSAAGHWVRTVGILAPLLIGEIVKDPEKKWRFVRITSVAMALVSEGLHTHGIRRERRERQLLDRNIV
jgi:hypothetical protein